MIVKFCSQESKRQFQSQESDNYVLELDDATKILNDKNGDPVNFGSMPLDKFLQAREHIDNDQIEKILEMN